MFVKERKISPGQRPKGGANLWMASSADLGYNRRGERFRLSAKSDDVVGARARVPNHPETTWSLCIVL